MMPGQLSVAEIVAGAARAGAKPPPRLTVSEWADKYRMLTPRSSPEPGNWRTERVPFLRDIMDSLSPFQKWVRVVFMKGAQVGGTECGNNWVGYVIHLAPGPMLLVQPTTTMAKRNSKQRIGPLISDSPVLRDLVKPNRTRDSGNTLLSKEFRDGILVMTGSNSASDLRSMPARYLFLDEVDGYPGDTDGEGEPCSLAIARTANFTGRRKIFIVSTPTRSGSSRVERFYAESDQCGFFLPCVYCNHRQVLVMEQLRWPKGRPEKAEYICEACGKGMPNHAKSIMLRQGIWSPRTEGDGQTRGYHLSSLYSPVGWKAWADVAREQEACGSDSQKLQVFWNTILGLPYADVGEAPDVDRLYERREDYKIGVVPIGGLYVTAGVDVQMRRLEIEIVAWGRGKQSWSVDYRVLEGDTTQPEVWRLLALLLDEDLPTEYGGTMRISRMAVDAGFNTTAVYDWVGKMSPQRVMAVKGNTHAPAIVSVPKLIEVGPQGRHRKHGVRLWPVNSSIAKEELYRWLRTAVPDLEAGEKWPVGFCHFPEYSKEYFEQLCAEQLIARTVAGRQHLIWEKKRDRNEALDCRIYARAAAASVRLDTWRESKWEELEKLVTIDVPVEPVPAVRGSWMSTPVPEFKPIVANTSFTE